MVDDARIRKTEDQAREFFHRHCRAAVRSGYQYIIVRGHRERAQPDRGQDHPSNLESAILRVPAVGVNEEIEVMPKWARTFMQLGLKSPRGVMDSQALREDHSELRGGDRGLTAVFRQTHIWSVPSSEQGNNDSHAIGLGAVHLHGPSARESGSLRPQNEGSDHKIYFYAVLYQRAGLRIERATASPQRGSTSRDSRSQVRVGRVLDKYTSQVMRSPRPSEGGAVRR